MSKTRRAFLEKRVEVAPDRPWGFLVDREGKEGEVVEATSEGLPVKRAGGGELKRRDGTKWLKHFKKMTLAESEKWMADEENVRAAQTAVKKMLGSMRPATKSMGVKVLERMARIGLEYAKVALEAEKAGLEAGRVAEGGLGGGNVGITIGQAAFILNERRLATDSETESST